MQEPVIEQVTAALELARLAVDADTNEDYGMAIRKYRETIFSMEKVKDRISQDGARALLAEKLQKYKQRLELLEGLFPSLSANPTVGGASRPPPSRPPPSFQPPYSPTPVQPTQSPTTNFTPATTPTPAPASTPAPAPTPATTTPTTTPSIPPWKRDPTLTAPPPPVATTPTPAPTNNTSTNSSGSIFFVEEEINFTASKSLEPPDSLNLRTFWLIRLLHQTMTTGGFLTPKLYVSTTVWDQKGAKFSAVQTKISCLQSVLEGLCKLSNVDVNNSDEGLRQFEEFCGVLNGAQNMLAKHLSFIKESKDEKKGIFKSVGTGMARLKTGLSSASTDDSYVVVLRETLAKATVFDKWLAKYENGSNKALWELLSRVCDFFYSVVISFVIRDFNMLLVRYMKKCNESFFED